MRHSSALPVMADEANVVPQVLFAGRQCPTEKRILGESMEKLHSILTRRRIERKVSEGGTAEIATTRITHQLHNYHQGIIGWRINMERHSRALK